MPVLKFRVIICKNSNILELIVFFEIHRACMENVRYPVRIYRVYFLILRFFSIPYGNARLLKRIYPKLTLKVNESACLS